MCFHEAGHIEAAYVWGGYVELSSVDWNGTPRTRTLHKPDLSTKEPVACGGYAAEWILFQEGYLINNSGTELPQQEFKSQAMENARLDKRPFYLKKPINKDGIYPDSPFQPSKDWNWPLESDDPFIDYAHQNIVPELKRRFETIRALAIALYENELLNQTEIEEIRSSYLPT